MLCVCAQSFVHAATLQQYEFLHCREREPVVKIDQDERGE